MIEIPLQLNMGHKTLSVTCQEDMEKLKAYSPNQILRAKLTGHRKPRSVQQNRWLHNMFRIVADNTEDHQWNDPKKVKRKIKMMLHFFDERFVVGDKIYFELRSFAFSELEQDEANEVFNQAKEVCAQKLGVEPEILEAQAKELPF